MGFACPQGVDVGRMPSLQLLARQGLMEPVQLLRQAEGTGHHLRALEILQWHELMTHDVELAAEDFFLELGVVSEYALAAIQKLANGNGILRGEKFLAAEITVAQTVDSVCLIVDLYSRLILLIETNGRLLLPDLLGYADGDGPGLGAGSDGGQAFVGLDVDEVVRPALHEALFLGLRFFSLELPFLLSLFDVEPGLLYLQQHIGLVVPRSVSPESRLGRQPALAQLAQISVALLLLSANFP